jgi:hypothetical protein
VWGSRLLCQGSNSQPSVAVYDTGIGVAMGMFIQYASPTLAFGTTGAGGVPTGIQMQLVTNGNLTIAGVLTQGSDARVKNNIKVFRPGISIVKRLLPKTFVFNNDEQNTRRLGFVAQDIEPILPDAITSIQGFEEGGSSLGLDSMAIIAVLTNAVTQLLNRIETLETCVGITPDAAVTA